jgi:hypothetical protein
VDISDDDKAREALLAQVAAGQGGCFAPIQARDVGFHRSTIWRYVRAGRWVEVMPGALTWGGVPIEPGVRRWAGVIAVSGGRTLAAGLAADQVPDGAVIVGLSHRTAATIIGTRLLDASALVELSRANGCHPRAPGLTLHRPSDLCSADLTLKYGPPCTTPERTLVDLAGIVPRQLVRWQMEEWLADRVVTFDRLEALLTRMSRRGRRGVGILRALVSDRALGDEPADSAWEAELAEVLLRHGVELPVHHLVLDDHGQVIAELDYAYPRSKVALEMNGYGVHLRRQERWEHGFGRQNAVELLGWSVLNYSTGMLRRDPAGIAKEIDEHRLARLGI